MVLAVSMRRDLISAGLRAGNSARMRAADPDACGVESEVPRK